MRLWIAEHRCGTYADLMVANGEPEFNGDRMDEILNPLLVVEVLSPPLKPTIELKSSENIALLLVFVNIYWLVKLNPTLSNIIMAIANVGLVGNGKRAIDDRAIVLYSLNIELPMCEISRRINF
ncbi:hypothetical protein [Microcoleus sp. herbarium2]|uniref:hypothetical protein n=1 Tax=Microcoleus sp. herbarium2 TaxID=3055433 RepID=UPI002FCF9FBE